MYVLRKILSVLLILILLPVLWAQIALYAAGSLLAETETVREVVRASGLYTDLADLLADQVADSLSRAEGSLPLTRAEAQALVREILPASRLESLGDQIVTGMHVWFVAGGGRPEVILDLTEIRVAVPPAVRRVISAKVAALPTCSPAQAVELSRNYRGGMPPCKSSDEQFNQRMIDQAMNAARVETLLPARLDLAAELEAANGPWFWDQLSRDLQTGRFLLGLVSWGWVVVALLLLLLAVLNLDRWYTPFGWIGGVLLAGGGVMLVGALGLLQVALPLLLQVPGGDPGGAFAVALAQSAVGTVGVAMRNVSFLLVLVGLGSIIITVAGAISYRPPQDPAARTA